MNEKRSVDNVDFAPLKRYVTFIGSENNHLWTCNFGCRTEPYTGTYSLIRKHMMGGVYSQQLSQAVPLCNKVPENIREQMRREDNEAMRSSGKKRIRIKSPPPSNLKVFKPTTSEPLGVSPDAPLEVPSSPQKTKPKISPLARLNPPQRRKSAEILECGLALAPQVKSVLASQLMSTSDVNLMVDMANNSFSYLDSLGADYLEFYRVVHAFISYHFDLAAAEAHKNCDAFCLKAEYEELEDRVKDAEKAHLRARTNISEGNQKLDRLKVKYDEVKKYFKILEQKVAESKVELVGLEAEDYRCAEAYAQAKAEVCRLAPRFDEAMVVVRDVEQRLETAVSGIMQMRNRLLTFG